jgi:adenosylcobinamide-phosphate synthase
VPVSAATAVLVAVGLDAAFGEPPARVHPVALFGRLVGRIERAISSGSVDRPARARLAGALVALVLPLGFAGVAAGVVGVGTRIDPWIGAALAGLALFSTTSLRLLITSARGVIDATETDLDRARHDLRALAGRDATELDAAHVRSAAVESLAENLADGLVAPLTAFALVAGGAGLLTGSGAVPAGTSAVAASTSLPAATGAAAWVKGVNTLDSMLGYHSKPVGWASARLDDLVMWLPARATALLLAIAGGSPRLPFHAETRALARRPASPNSGWPMATMAAVLSVRLRKPDAYDLDPETAVSSDASDSAKTGDGDGEGAPLPDVAAATRGIRVTRRAGLLAVAVAGVAAWW